MGMGDVPTLARTSVPLVTPRPAPGPCGDDRVCLLPDGTLGDVCVQDSLETYLVMLDEAQGFGGTVDPDFEASIDALEEAPVEVRSEVASLMVSLGHVQECSWDQQQQVLAANPDDVFVSSDNEDASAWWESGYRVVAFDHGRAGTRVHSRELEPSERKSMQFEEVANDRIHDLQQQFEVIAIDRLSSVAAISDLLVKCCYTIPLSHFSVSELEVFRESFTPQLSTGLVAVNANGEKILVLSGPNAGAAFDLLSGDDGSWQYGSRGDGGSCSRIARAYRLLRGDDQRHNPRGGEVEYRRDLSVAAQHAASQAAAVTEQRVHRDPWDGIKGVSSEADWAEFLLWLDFKSYVHYRESQGLTFVGVNRKSGAPLFTRRSEPFSSTRSAWSQIDGVWDDKLKCFREIDYDGSVG